ncbi:hypothetical protein [uncultured Kiloniella sp.]|uniref:hypothetical protein n=1 Tax=uncultured Kiloniella sp. TaxID=1133091 RepID=UPI00261FE197|nr:hypothetical protein [uncultured Kiloniella sp.]
MMPNSPLSSKDRTELTYLFDCYGAYSHHWPEEKRDWASNLIDHHPEAKVLRDQALEFDRLLDQSPAEPDSVHLINSILAQAPQKKQQPNQEQSILHKLWPFESIWRPISALTTAGIFGILLGTTSPAFLYQQEAIEMEIAYLEFSLGDNFTNNFPEGEID